MSSELKTEGKYELYTSIDGRKILNLDNQAYYEVGDEEQDNFMKYSEADPPKDSSIATGKYYFAGKDSKSGSGGSFKIYLQEGSEYKVYGLPEGLPLQRDEPEKKLVQSDKKFSQDEVFQEIRK